MRGASATTLSILTSHAPLRSRLSSPRTMIRGWRLTHNPVFNVSTRKVGGLRFVKLGRFTFMFCVSREYKAL